MGDVPFIDGPEPLNSRGPGWYRLRAHAVNRDLMHDLVVSGEPIERYLVQVWPEEGPRDAVVWREESEPAGVACEEAERASDAHPRVVPTLSNWTPPLI